MDSPPRKAPTRLPALAPLRVLVGPLAASVYLFRVASTQGPMHCGLIR